MSDAEKEKPSPKFNERGPLGELGFLGEKARSLSHVSSQTTWSTVISGVAENESKKGTLEKVVVHDGRTHREDGDSDASFEDDDNIPTQKYTAKLKVYRDTLNNHYFKRKTVIKRILFVVLAVLYVTFVVGAIVYNFQNSIPLIILTIIGIVIAALIVASRDDNVRSKCSKCYLQVEICWNKYWNYTRWVLAFVLLASLIVFIAVDVRHDPRRLTSLTGFVLLLSICFIFSKYPDKIRWRPVIWGLVMQFIFGLLVLRWRTGLLAVEWFSEKVVGFLTFADEGSRFVFGEDYRKHEFAFQSLPVVIFFSSIIGILYYWGVMQFLLRCMASFMQVTMGTTALESLATASNIFVSYVEVAPMLLPYMDKLTRSEMHAILTSGFATVAGSILAIYYNLGAPLEHLISACLVSAPAALAVAKLSYPETKKSKTKTQEDVILPPRSEKNFVEAAANGAMAAIKLVAGIAVCLIAFLAIMAFLNTVLAWFGDKVGISDPSLSFDLICSYLLWPLAVMMGVDPKDAKRVAKMLGLKIFVDDVLCYADLGAALEEGAISNRSSVIATYACCGFGSLGALGIAVGAMMAIAPQRKSAIGQIIVRALINGNIAAFMTACLAGLLYDPHSRERGDGLTTDFTNATTPWPHYTDTDMTSDVTLDMFT